MAYITSLIDVFPNIFIPLILFYSLIKVIRTAILSTNRWLNLDDINIIFIVSGVIGLIIIQPLSSVKITIFFIFTIYSILLWVDAIIFYLYSFEINKQNLHDFFADYKSMLHYSSRSSELLKRYPWLLFGIPASFTAIIIIFFEGGVPMVYTIVFPVILTVSVFILQRFSQAIIRNTIILAVITCAVFFLSGQLLTPIDGLANYSKHIFVVMLIAVLILLNIVRKRYEHPFFTLTSHFRKFLKQDSLTDNPSIVLRKEHLELIDPPTKTNQLPTKYFGLLKGANVIFITVESLGAKYLHDAMDLPFFSKITKSEVRSDKHLAISPHTNQFLMHLFSSNYNDPNGHQLHKLLKSADYQTSFISSDNLNLCESRELIDEIGFRNIIDKNDLYPINQNKGDALLLDAIPIIEDMFNDGLNFLQVLTVQSHYPYVTFGNKNLASRLGTDLKTKYFNTIVETDNILNTLFEKLSMVIDLDNTLIVYTGDHGESFGELGYKAHSNSTINAQLRVPFYLKHKLLNKQKVGFSTHFDIMPTILDLLGIENAESTVGSSIFAEDRELPSLYYSTVRKDNAPANVKIRLAEKNIMIDRVLDYAVVIDENDNILRRLDKAEIAYYNTLAYRMLKTRNLIN